MLSDAQAALAQVREALAAGPTPGPWRWEVSAHSKRLQLVGGLRPQYDLTVMGFARWGMSGATVKLRDLTPSGMDLLYRLHERADWIAPIPGREHHANWCSTVTHPDAAFIAKCNPENVAAILAHVDAQKAEIERLTAERDELRRQLAEAEQDARRYRDWLRGGANIPPESTRWARWEVRYWDGRHWNTLFAEALDTSIDAAMGGSNA